MMKKYTIKNRNDLRVVIQVDEPENPTNLVFIAHGQGGFIAQPHIEAFARAFLKNNFRVVRFDATHALGESDGDIIDVTYNTYVSDLEDVIIWAKSQEWFQLPFALCGHSMGAQSTAWYAEHNPQNVWLLAPMAPPINYELYTSTMVKDDMKQWQKRGYKQIESRSKPGVTKRIGWNAVDSIRHFDLLPKGHRLTMPLLNIVGEYDIPCPSRNQEHFMRSINNPATAKLITIAGVEHSYRDAISEEVGEGLKLVEDKLTQWVYEHTIQQ